MQMNLIIFVLLIIFAFGGVFLKGRFRAKVRNTYQKLGLSCQARVTVTICFVYKVIRDF